MNAKTIKNMANIAMYKMFLKDRAPFDASLLNVEGRKELQALFQIRRNIHKKKKKCYFNGCNNDAINSHLLQKNGTLDLLKENDKVLMIKANPFDQEAIKFEKLGLNEVFTCKGFCNKHDTNIFLKIENKNVDYYDYECQLLFSYRAILNQYLIHGDTCQMYIKAKNRNKGWNSLLEPHLTQTEYYMSVLKYMLDELEKNLINLSLKDYHFEIFEFKDKIGICASSVVPLSNTLYSTKQGCVVSNIENSSDLIFNIIPAPKSTILMLGYLKNGGKEAFEYTKNFISMNKKKRFKIINDILLGAIDTWILSESFFKEHISHNQTIVINEFRNLGFNPNTQTTGYNMLKKFCKK